MKKYIRVVVAVELVTVGDKFVEAFSNEQIAQYAISDGQTKMGDNGKYLRLLWEVSSEKIGKEKNGH